MGAEEKKSFVQAPPWMIMGPPALALVLLGIVEIARLDEPLFFFFNAFPDVTGPLFWANVTILGDGLVCAVLLLPWIRRRTEVFRQAAPTARIVELDSPYHHIFLAEEDQTLQAINGFI